MAFAFMSSETGCPPYVVLFSAERKLCQEHSTCSDVHILPNPTRHDTWDEFVGLMVLQIVIRDLHSYRVLWRYV